MVVREQRSCVVCKTSSHRVDWIKKQGEHVACDHHSDKEIAAAIEATKPPAPAPPVDSQAGQPIVDQTNEPVNKYPGPATPPATVGQTSGEVKKTPPTVKK